MTGAKEFVRENWASLISLVLLVGGAVYQFGFQARNFTAFQEELVAFKKAQSEQVEKLQRHESEIQRLQWVSDNQNKTLEEIKLDVRTTERRTTDMKESISVILEILKPIKAGVH